MSRILAASAPSAIDEAITALRSGAVIAIPTETVYGVAVLPNDAGVARLIEVKHRSAEKGIQLLVDSIDQAAEIAEVGIAASRLAEAFWPGGLTIVLRRRGDTQLPEGIGGGRPTLGIRLPDHEVPRALARVVGPIAASSANISGEPDATTAQRVVESLGADLDLILDDGPVRGGVPSTVVDCSDPDSPPRVLREGAISMEDIAATVG